MHSVETPTMSFTLRDDGVIVGRGKPTDNMRTEPEVARNLAVMDELLGGQLAPALWYPDEVLRYEADALQRLIHGLVQRLTAVAIVASDPPPALAAFPGAVNALLLPVRIFEQEADAEQWLHQFTEYPSGPENHG
ncbi:MAG: hypothetical protein QNJ89_09805 [Acidimicrobiia bacterium]|nr:hypothetical protein [Acidimicrobiia bacterium]